MNNNVFGWGIIGAAFVLSTINLVLLAGLWTAKSALGETARKAVAALSRQQPTASVFATTVAVDTVLTVPIQASVPIKTVVRVPLSVPIAGETVISVPVDTAIPIDTTVQVPIKTSVPVRIASSDIPLGGLLQELQEWLNDLARIL